MHETFYMQSMLKKEIVGTTLSGGGGDNGGTVGCLLEYERRGPQFDARNGARLI